MLEMKLKRAIKNSGVEGLIILDVTAAHRAETAVAQYILRRAREYARYRHPWLLLLAGLQQGSGICDDFARGGIECSMEERKSMDFAALVSAQADGTVQVFVSLDDAFKAIKTDFASNMDENEQRYRGNFGQMLGRPGETRHNVAKSSHRSSVKTTLLDAKRKMLSWIT